MSLSKEDRLKNIKDALKIMLDRLGERGMYVEFFSPQDPSFSNIHSTTWQEMERRGLIRGHHMQQSDSYDMCGPGWFYAMELAGKLDTPEFNERFGKLSAAVKRKVDGRQQRQPTTVEALAQETALPAHWIYNIIKSNVWRHRNHRIGVEFDHQEVVWIPSDFNMEPL